MRVHEMCLLVLSPGLVASSVTGIEAPVTQVPVTQVPVTASPSRRLSRRGATAPR
jgi:hypothetical protein